MNRLILGIACVALVAVSVHARTAYSSARVIPATWTVAQPESIQSADVHTMVGSSFHAIRAGF